MAYAFRNRIILGDTRLQSQTAAQMLDDAGTAKIALSAMRDDNFSDAKWLILEGDGFETPEQASSAGKVWRQLLSASFARAGIGADFDPLPLPKRRPEDLPEDRDAPGLIVFPRQPGLTFRVESWAELPAARPLESFLSEDLSVVRHALPDGLQERPQLDLAYRLMHLGLLNAHLEVKYILFVTAIEALIPDSRPQKGDAALIAALDSLMAFAQEPSRFDRNTRDKILGSLGYLKRESISSYGAKLAANLNGTYDGLSAAEYFERAYKRRSTLVHANLSDGSRLDPREIGREIDILRQFTLDWLARELDDPQQG